MPVPSGALVCVEADPVAAAYAAATPRRPGSSDRVEVREVADGSGAATRRAVRRSSSPTRPGYAVPRRQQFPDDPLAAIDGGDDGLDVARECVLVIGGHLAPAGAALLQLGSADQVDALAPELSGAGLRVTEVRGYDRGVVALLGRESDA